MTPDAGVLGWVVATLVGVIAAAFAGVFAWLFKVHLPLKETQYQELLKLAASERDKTDAIRTTERKELSAAFTDAIENLLKKHELDAEKDRAAFMQRSIESNEAFKQRSNELKDAILNQTRSFEKAIEHWAASVSMALTNVCEASAFGVHRRIRDEPGSAPKNG